MSAAVSRGVVAARLRKLGLELPPPFRPSAAYVPCTFVEEIAILSGHGPYDGRDFVCGKVGADLSVAEGYDAARLAALSCLSTLHEQLGTLDLVARVVRVCGLVNSAPGFTALPSVIDGGSDLLVELFGDAGKHARTVLGAAELPLGIAVEIEMQVLVRGQCA